MAEEEVQALVYVLDVHTLLVSPSTQDQLLKVQERALVGYMLTDLQTATQTIATEDVTVIARGVIKLTPHPTYGMCTAICMFGCDHAQSNARSQLDSAHKVCDPVPDTGRYCAKHLPNTGGCPNPSAQTLLPARMLSMCLGLRLLCCTRGTCDFPPQTPRQSPAAGWCR